MKITTVLSRTLLALIAFSSPAILSSILAEPSVAQATGKTGQAAKAPVWPPTTSPSPIASWTRDGQGVTFASGTFYRLRFQIQFSKYSTSTPGIFESRCEVVFGNLERWIFGWQNVTPSNTFASGAFSGPRSPSNGLGGSGYHYSNPFTNAPMTAGKLRHFTDISGPGFEMTHGTYSVKAYTPGGSPVSAKITW